MLVLATRFMRLLGECVGQAVQPVRPRNRRISEKDRLDSLSQEFVHFFGIFRFLRSFRYHNFLPAVIACVMENELSWIRQSRSDSTCYPLDVVDLVDEMDKKINPLAGEVHWVHNVHLVHGLVERAAFNCRF